MKNIAFICYGNACRSQIAEALFRKKKGTLFTVYSAGIHPLGFIPPEIITLAENKGIDLNGHYSKGLEEIPLEKLDFLVSLIGQPAEEIAPPEFKGCGITWDIPDPYGRSPKAYENMYALLLKKIDEIDLNISGEVTSNYLF